MARFAWLLLVLPLLACSPARRGSDDDDDDSAADDDDATPDDDDSTPDDDDVTPNDDDSTDVGPDVVIIAVAPEPEDDDVFVDGAFWVRFDRAPDSAGLSLTEGGQPVDLDTWEEASGTVLSWLAVDGLEPETDYELTLSWSPNSAGDFTYGFTTSDAGLPLSNPTALVNRVFSTDLATGNFVEPPGVGPILQSQLDGVVLLCDIAPESDFSPSAQPGLHFVSGMGEQDGNDIVPEQCSEVSWLTAGSDQQIGTSDDDPADWSNPSFDLGPFNMSMPMQGLSVDLNDVVMTGTYAQDGGSIVGGTLSATIDTRPLAPELDPEGGEGAVCDLVEETVGVECEPCPDGQPFCLSLVVTELISEYEPNLDLDITTCVDILDDFGCEDEWDQYDEDGDGTYEGCPGF